MAPSAQSPRAWLLKYGDFLPAGYLAEKSQLSVPISPLDSSHGLDRFLRFLVFWCKSCWWKVEGALLVRSEVLLLSVVPSVHLCGAQSVNAILAKLPPSWRDFVTSRRHRKKQMTLTELSAAINVEERARSSNKPSQQLQAHVVEKGGDRKFQKKKKNSPQKNMNQPKSKKMKKKKEDFICYVCGVSGAPVLMGNGVPAAVRGTGQVYLKLTSGKTLVLKDVLYGLKLVFESNKVVLSKFGTFVGKSYESGGLFRLSV
ncbi:uncharacterized protein, partial [Zea mays]|uniref:uncharacterized protein n=1 Tax=Zea mays TaxID=4577 RepID=UPI0016520C83